MPFASLWRNCLQKFIYKCDLHWTVLKLGIKYELAFESVSL